MAWNLTDWSAVPVPGVSDFQGGIRDPLAYLMTGRPVAEVIRVVGIGTPYTTSSTSFVDVDATNVKVTVNLSGSRAIVIARMNQFAMGNQTGYACADIIRDSTTRLGDATYGLAQMGQNTLGPHTLIAVATGLMPGSHDFKLQYKVSQAGGVATIGFTTLYPGVVTMEVWEY